MTFRTATPPFLPSREEMEADLLELNVEASSRVIDSLAEFSRLLVNRSRFANLIGPDEKKRLWRRHILESACFSKIIEQGRAVVDIGSGNGFPGIVLAILGSETCLLEPRRKRFLFLRFAVTRLGLAGCTVRQVRLEDLAPAAGPVQYTARSVAPAEELLHMISTVSGAGSTLVCRQPCLASGGRVTDSMELRCPPLDRGGFLVQYRV